MGIQNGHGLVFPGDVIKIPDTYIYGSTGVVVSNEDAEASIYFTGLQLFDKWLWFKRLTHFDSNMIGNVTAEEWDRFYLNGGIGKFIISRASKNDHSKSQSSCNHLSIKKVFIGVGASGSEIEVCTTCKEEV